jgi:BASS family bile acid:Na+ symporter
MLMRVLKAIEKYYWVFLAGGIVVGLIYPVGSVLVPLVKPILMVMLFIVFLKTDPLHILENIRDYKLMTYIVVTYMLVIPVIFYFLAKLFIPGLAVGVLLLTAMPAGVSSPTLVDIVKGNTALSVSIVIVTAVIAPFTVPLLFWIIRFHNLTISPELILKDMAIIVFLPLIIAHLVKKYLKPDLSNKESFFTSVNVILLFLLVYAVVSNQHDIILGGSLKLVWQLLIVYVIFILLHFIGYVMGYGQSKANKTTLAIGKAYMNNGMAIVLAASHFEPSVLIFMVLSEFPWSTLLAPFKKVVDRL